MPKKFDLEQFIPKFKNPIVKELYYYNLSIDRQTLRDIINKYLMNLFEEGVVETQIVGSESIEEAFPTGIKEIKSIYDRYDELERIYNRPLEPQLQSVFNPTYPKVGRNAPCPCGSGRKYKKCHLNM